VTLIPGLWATHGHQNRHRSIRRLWLPIKSSVATKGLSHDVSEITEISVENLKNFQPLYFAPLLKGFPWNWASVLGSKKLEWCGYRADKEVWRYFRPSG